MPTVIEPKTSEDAQAQPVAPSSNQPELFAAEVAMEGKHSGIMPMLFIAGYDHRQLAEQSCTLEGCPRRPYRTRLRPARSTRILDAADARQPSVSAPEPYLATANDKPQDPHYKLLAKSRRH